MYYPGLAVTTPIVYIPASCRWPANIIYPLCQSLLDDIINSVNILAERALSSIEAGLLQQSPESLGFRAKPMPPKRERQQAQDQEHLDDNTPADPQEAARLEIESGTHQLETLLCANIDKNFDKFEVYVLRNVLSVKPGEGDWMQLAHYQGLDFSLPPDGEGDGDAIGGAGGSGNSRRATLESVNALRRKLRASQRLHTRLVEEKARNESLLGQLRALIKGKNCTSGDTAKMLAASSGDVGHDDIAMTDRDGEKPINRDAQPIHNRSFAFLDRNRSALAGADATAPLETTSAFVLSQLTALRALSSSLRNLAPDLATTSPIAATRDGDEENGDSIGAVSSSAPCHKSWRRERAEYVEGEMRKHLQYVRGLELEADGSVRDGEWQGEGRSLGRDGVEGLEKVAGFVGQGE